MYDLSFSEIAKITEREHSAILNHLVVLVQKSAKREGSISINSKREEL